MVSEDFSFPKINFSLPSFAVSPSLWRVSSLVYPDYASEIEEIIELEDTEKSNSGNYLKNGEEKTETENHCRQEKMDMLWEEYFKEELRKISSAEVSGDRGVSAQKSWRRRRSGDSERSREEETAEVCCAAKNANGAKILKRIFHIFT